MGEAILNVTVFLAMILGDLIVAGYSFKKRTVCGKYLGLTSLFAFLVAASYAITLFVTDYFWYSVFSSVYFIGVDLTLLSLTRFVRSYVGTEGNGWYRAGRALIHFLYVLDIVLLALNPFKELSIHYERVIGKVTPYVYDMRLPYKMHLTLSYILIVVIVLYLVKKGTSVPAFYRRQYVYAILVIFLVVLINAAYLALPSLLGMEILDYSLIGYTVAAVLLYYVCFVYTNRSMIDMLKNHIYTSVDRGILLFDYDNRLILKNERAEEMLEGVSWIKKPTVEDAARLAGGDQWESILDSGSGGENYTFQCYPGSREKRHPLRCTYSMILGPGGDVLGRLFMFSELSSEFDPLTGFYYWGYYKQQPLSADRTPAAAAACDIRDLSKLNRMEGNLRGDRAIQDLARLMKASFPDSTIFVRGREAILVAVCEGKDEEFMYSCVEEMQKRLAEKKEETDENLFDFQYGIRLSDPGETHVDMIRGAMKNLDTKRLTDHSSRHSDMIYSCVRMLQEYDPDSGARVRRIRKLCLRLAERIGLNENQKNDLALLSIFCDVGKIGIPITILNKRGALNAEEWDIQMAHVERGVRLAESSPELKEIAPMIRSHHERWDGRGYPDGLSKESIPVLSRIISIADAYDAMTNKRSYRRIMSPKEACAEIRRCAGTQFDPTIAEKFIGLMYDDGVLAEPLPELSKESKENADGVPYTEWSLGTREASGEIPRVHRMACTRYVINSELRIVKADDGFTLLTGYSLSELEPPGLTQLDLIFEQDRSRYISLVHGAFEEGDAAYLEHWIRRKDGTSVFVNCYGRRQFDQMTGEKCYEIIVGDVSNSYSIQSIVQSENEKASHRLKQWEKKFRRDSLTGLLTHEAFRNDVETCILSGASQALMLMMDVDHFKEYNDTYGHHAGDEFLIMVGRTLLASLRGGDFASRMGGDEFAAFLLFRDESQKEKMTQRATQIFDEINSKLAEYGGDFTTLSMGGAFLDKDHNTFERLYEAADSALYRSKESGRARISF